MAILKDTSPCIETTYWRNPRGYGMVGKDSKVKLHHRLVWEQHHGPIPKGLLVRHLCHNTSCVNVKHLTLGTHKDNRQDDVDAGRMTWSLKGEKCGKAKLTEVQAREILDCKPDKITSRSLQPYAQQYNVHPDTIRCIWRRHTWKHL